MREVEPIYSVKDAAGITLGNIPFYQVSSLLFCVRTIVLSRSDFDAFRCPLPHGATLDLPNLEVLAIHTPEHITPDDTDYMMNYYASTNAPNLSSLELGLLLCHLLKSLDLSSVTHLNVQIRIEGFMPFLPYVALCKNLTTSVWDNFGVGLSTPITSAFELPKLTVFKYIFAEDDNDAI
ncbi:hypothetical protein M422DRAFT_52620 [Sphaerobolus stellatus SS14]|uniref:Uncharacterized protein n=1 Tax=Sphaerobolus stellatus (strain SS14) TaxID=990650 RepID=A0A0C9UUN9_SPHS4|nr:hypothetical protein M422DRAFT_52620 [Sphaerobolus stellatus SS14]